MFSNVYILNIRDFPWFFLNGAFTIINLFEYWSRFGCLFKQIYAITAKSVFCSSMNLSSQNNLF